MTERDKRKAQEILSACENGTRWIPHDVKDLLEKIIVDVDTRGQLSW